MTLSWFSETINKSECLNHFFMTGNRRDSKPTAKKKKMKLNSTHNKPENILPIQRNVCAHVQDLS